jgi:triphosphatase
MLEITATPAREAAGAASPPDRAPRRRKRAKAVVASDVQEATTKFSRQQSPASESSSANEAAAIASVPDRTTATTGEIELKLLVDATRLAEFNAAPVITANARNKGNRKHLKSVYYDTPERVLRRNGLSLHVRQRGTRFVQTVKADFADHPLRRGQWEASVPSIAPDIALAMPFIPVKLGADLARDGLEAVFSADIHRHARMIDLPSGTVEVAFDQGVLKAGERSMPVSEIELELKRGDASIIYELALRIAEQGQVRPSIRAKSARGFDLADDALPPTRRPRKLRLDASTSLDEAFATILRACLRHLLESLPAAEDGRDPEGVHQLRVALRRLRSALDLMRSAGQWSQLDALRSEARWLAKNLSAARDWDIFQADTLPTIARACPSVAGFDALARVTSKRRQAAYRQVHLALADSRCSRFLLGLGRWIEARGWRSGEVAPETPARLAEPAINFAGAALSAQHAKVLKRGRHFKSLGIEELHRLRLAAKKLRYVADFLLPLYQDRNSVKQFSRKLAALQEELGCYNDMAVTASLLDGLTSESSESSTAGAVIVGWQAHASLGIAPRLRSAWRDFTKTRIPWSRGAEG